MNIFILPHWSYGWPIMDIPELHRFVNCYCGEILTDSKYEPSCKKTKRIIETETNEESEKELPVLAEFSEETKHQIMEIHITSENIEKRIEYQRLQNKLLEDKLQIALLSESVIMII